MTEEPDLPDMPLDDPKEEEKRLQSRLNREKIKSNTLWQKVYQQMMLGKLPKGVREGTKMVAQQQGISSDVMDSAKRAFGEGYSMRMFREGFEGKSEQPQQAKEGEKSSFWGELMNWQRVDPEGAKEFFNGLSKEQLDKIAYLDSSKGGGMPLWAAMRDASGGKKSGISEAKEIMDAMPKPPTVNETLDSFLKMKEMSTPTTPTTANPEIEGLKEQVSALVASNEKLLDKLHEMDLKEKDKVIEAKERENAALRQQVITPENIDDFLDKRQTRFEKTAEKMGYVKAGESKGEADRRFLLDAADTLGIIAAPILEGVGDRVRGAEGSGGFKYVPCEGKMPDGKVCGYRRKIPWPIPETFSDTCPKCGSVLHT